MEWKLAYLQLFLRRVNGVEWATLSKELIFWFNPNAWNWIFYCQTFSGYSDLILFIADRGEVPRGSAEIFFRKVKFWEDGELQEAPPVFVGIIFLNQEESMC